MPSRAEFVDEYEAALDAFTSEFLAVFMRGMRKVLAPAVVSAATQTFVASAVEEPWEEFVSANLNPLLVADYGAAGLSAWVGRGQDLAYAQADHAAGALVRTHASSAVRHAAAAQNRMVRFSDSLWLHARGQIAEGIASGKTIEEMKNVLWRDFGPAGVYEQRAEVVARTEVHAAVNAGHEEGMALLGAHGPKFKEWLSTSDGRTRPTHAAADGQAVPRDSHFVVGGARLRFPGDPSGPAEEVIQCRCVVLYVDDPGETPRDNQGYPLAQAAPAPTATPPPPAQPRHAPKADRPLGPPAPRSTFTPTTSAPAPPPKPPPPKAPPPGASFNTAGFHVGRISHKNPWELTDAAKVEMDGLMRAVQDDLVRMYDTHLRPVGLRTDGLQFTHHGANNVEWHARIVDADGEFVGHFDRGLYLNNDNRWEVHHNLWSLEAEVQGQGLATKINDAAFDLYRAWGVDEVTLLANIDVGGYAWAKQGFAWDRSAHSEVITMFGRVERRLDEYFDTYLPETLEAARADLAVLRQRARDFDPSHPSFPSPFDISRIGYRDEIAALHPAKKGYRWVGKDAMLGSTWYGVLPLA